MGGVLVFPDQTGPRFFGPDVPRALVDKWFAAMKHIIGPVETYALVVARSLWHQYLVGKRRIFFCHNDNYGAMDAFIKGSSSNADIRELLLCFEKLECNGSHWPWFSRVPSASNCADDPTRVGNVLGKFLAGAIRYRCFCPISGVELQTSWAQRDLVSGVERCVSPHCLSKRIECVFSEKKTKDRRR